MRTPPAVSKTDFSKRGFVGPVPVLERGEAGRFLADVTRPGEHTPLDWTKGWAAASRPYFVLGCHPRILAVVSELLGDDVLLWGAMLVKRGPGEAHAWHSDLETCAPEGRTVSVWLGLENCSEGSSLHLVPGSHRFGQTLQERRAADPRAADSAETVAIGPADALRWARECDPASESDAIAMADGEALFFDGRLWHGSDNSTRLTRTALLLQYANPSTPIRIPMSFDWPPQFLERPLPPCVLISGEDRAGVNRVVAAPAAPGSRRGPRLTGQARPVTLPLEPDAGEPWTPFPIFHGTTAGQRRLTCHISALAPGATPHPPHTHDDEELLMVLDGEADIVLPEHPDGRQRLVAGDCVYYPAHFPHTLVGAGDKPVNYLMLKWLGDPSGSDRPIEFRRFAFAAADGTDNGADFQTRMLFEGPTRWLHKLHCHTTALAPGAGYRPHADAYDVVMIMLEGEVESLGQRLSPHGVFFYAAGEPHGAHNPGSVTARYAVFEFHALPTVPHHAHRETSRFRRWTDPRRWRRRLLRDVRNLRARLRSG